MFVDCSIDHPWFQASAAMLPAGWNNHTFVLTVNARVTAPVIVPDFAGAPLPRSSAIV
jgi:hypothetical protein